MLKTNTSDSFPGADYVAANAIAPGECCFFSTTAALAAALGAAGVPYVFRMGKLWFDLGPSALVTMCQGPAGSPTSFSADPMTVGAAANVYGTGFGAVEGKFWLTDDAAWGEEGVKIRQTIGMWEADDIDFDVTRDGLPVAPAKIYGYVETVCGAVNAVGLEGTIAEP